MTNETRSKLLGAFADAGRPGGPTYKDAVQALTAHEQAVSAEAVLAFAEWLDAHPRVLSTAHDDFAAEFITAQGWSLPKEGR